MIYKLEKNHFVELIRVKFEEQFVATVLITVI